MANHFEDSARARKVAELYQVARACAVTALEVATAADVRDALVELAGVRQPSDMTWRLLVGALATAERQDRAAA